MASFIYQIGHRHVQRLKKRVSTIWPKNREMVLEELKQQWQTTFDALGTSVCVLDNKYNIVHCNKATVELFQQPAEAIIGAKCFQLVHGTDAPPENCPVWQLRDGQPRQVGELHFRDRWIEVAVDALRDDNGRFRGMIHVIQDITDRKWVEGELRRSEQRFRALSELLPQTVFEMDSSGRLTFVNDNALKVFGYSREDFKKGLQVLDMIAPQDHPVAWRTIGEVLQGRSELAGRRFLARRKDGSTFPILAYSATSLDRNGEAGIRGIIIDTTEQEKLVRERDKLEEQYIQAQKMEAVGRLAGGVAHDLNNMLTPILGYGEMLLESTPAGAPNRRPIEQICSAGERARGLVQQLLAFSRKQALDIQAINLNTILASFESLLGRILRDDIKLALNLSSEIPNILADPGQIEQIVMNLAVNAQDAMPDGGTISVSVGVAEVGHQELEKLEIAQPGPYVVLTFSDNGCGIDAGTQERVFDPFFTTKGQGKGTGLGLATVYGIVKQHGGSIQVSSEPGLGTVFNIFFPAYSSPSAAVPTKKELREDFSGKENIVIVEDNNDVRSMIESILRHYGYQTFTVAGGRECLDLLEQRPHLDLILTDVILEDTNGKELYEEVRRRLPGIKVVYMSGYTNDVIVHHGVLDEGITFIQKPFSIPELVGKVRAALDGK